MATKYWIKSISKHLGLGSYQLDLVQPNKNQIYIPTPFACRIDKKWRSIYIRRKTAFSIETLNTAFIKFCYCRDTWLHMACFPVWFFERTFQFSELYIFCVKKALKKVVFFSFAFTRLLYNHFSLRSNLNDWPSDTIRSIILFDSVSKLRHTHGLTKP